MEKFNIKRNREPLSEEDIRKGQDFNAFMNAYEAKQSGNSGTKSFFRSPKFFALAAVAILAIIAGVFFFSDEESAIETPVAFIDPAFDGAGAPDTTFTVDAATGGMLFDAYGTIINIPPFAFHDSSGKVVNGNIEIRFRQYFDIADIFLAGIPMQYDSAGKSFHFETAGMFEISAWQNGQALQTNPDALIHVAMVSTSADTRFSTYYLDTAAKKWNYIATEKAVTFAPPAADTADVLPVVLPEAPVAPRLADKNKPSFAIAFDPAEFPELVAYKGVRFEVDETQTPYNKSDRKVAWEDVVIRRMKHKDQLSITFSAGEREVKYVTYPVVNEKEFPSAKAAWEKRNAEYEAMKKQREAREQQQVLDQQKKAEAAQIAWISDSIAHRQRGIISGDGMRTAEELIVLREFVIADFGFWNADCPEECPDDFEIIFLDPVASTGEQLDIQKFYHVVKGKNALYSYGKNNWTHFTFDPAAENMIWAITRDKKLATVSAEEFRAATASGNRQVAFRFTVSAQPLADGEQARAQLGL
jgi:hypothetical protein